MTQVYRILRAAYARTPLARNPFEGEGAYRYGGRWSSPGTRLCYTSEHQSLAMLEYFVHLDANDPPEDLVLVTAEVPDKLARERIEADTLPHDWRATPSQPVLARLGDEFAQRGKSAILLVPSALAVTEYNWLLNPQHPDFARIRVQPPQPLQYDPRMFSKSSRHRKVPR